MKNLLILLLIAPFVLSAQDVPKRATQIFVNNEKNAKSNYEDVSLFLVENDFGIENRDPDLNIITLEPFEYKNLFLKISIFCKDSIIRVTGQTKFGHSIEMFGMRSEDNWFKIEARGQRGSVSRKSFDGMEEFARKLGANLTYK